MTASRGRTAMVMVMAMALVLGACRAGNAPDAVSVAPDALAASTLASGPADAAASALQESQWKCADQSIAARVDTAAASATLTHARGQLLLPQAVSDAGARYADDNGNAFHTLGEDATLTLSGTPEQACTRIHPVPEQAATP